MRIESTKGKNEYKCWLTPEEVNTLEQVAKERSQKHHAVILLGSRVGLRAEEMTRIRPDDIRRQERNYWLRVTGKDTTGKHGIGKERDAYLPERVERELLELQLRHSEIHDDQPYLDVSPTRIRQIVSEAAEEAYEVTDNQDWKRVSSHDLRRYFAQTALVRERMNPRVVMAVGGWDSFQAIEPYLNAPTSENIAQEFEAAGLD